MIGVPGLLTRHALWLWSAKCNDMPLLRSQYRAKVDSCLPAYLDYVVLPSRTQCYAWWRQRLVSRQLDILR